MATFRIPLYMVKIVVNLYRISQTKAKELLMEDYVDKKRKMLYTNMIPSKTVLDSNTVTFCLKW